MVPKKMSHGKTGQSGITSIIDDSKAGSSVSFMSSMIRQCSNRDCGKTVWDCEGKAIAQMSSTFVDRYFVNPWQVQCSVRLPSSPVWSLVKPELSLVLSLLLGSDQHRSTMLHARRAREGGSPAKI